MATAATLPAEVFRIYSDDTSTRQRLLSDLAVAHGECRRAVANTEILSGPHQRLAES